MHFFHSLFHLIQSLSYKPLNHDKFFYLFFQRLVCISLKPGSLSQKPSLVIYEFSPTWRLQQRQIHNISGLNYAHDFLLLPNYYVFHMTPFVKVTLLSVAKILANWSAPGQQMKYYSDLPSKFVIIPRQSVKGNKDIIMVDTDPFHVSFAEKRIQDLY